MAIEITAEKVVDRGVRKYKITGLKALSEADLPKEYTDGTPSLVRFRENSFFLRGWEWNNMSVGETVSESTFISFLDHCRKCGERLKEINARLEKENAGWEGTITHII